MKLKQPSEPQQTVFISCGCSPPVVWPPGWPVPVSFCQSCGDSIEPLPAHFERVDTAIVHTTTKSCTSACILDVTAGTNCPQGGDTGHGGRTLLRLTDQGGTAISLQVKLHGRKDAVEFGDFGDIESVRLIFGGDAECDVLIEALEFARDVLTRQVEARREQEPAAAPPNPHVLADGLPCAPFPIPIPGQAPSACTHGSVLKPGETGACGCTRA